MRVIETGPILPAVDLATFKSSVHIAVDDLDDDAALTTALEAAESLVSIATGRPLTPRAMEFTVTRGTWCRWWFPTLPVQDLLALAIDDGAGGWVDQSLDGAWVQQQHDEPQLVLGSAWAGHSAGGDVLRVQARVGYDGVNPAPQLKQAMILIAKEWFEAGIAIEGEAPPRLSFGGHRLIKQVRYRRPCEVA
jgi:uncharacterized phiE125 gp8 family phage protein